MSSSIFTDNLLAKWLKKKGIKDYYALTEEEKSSYNQLKNALEGKKLTDEDVAKFWRETIDSINEKLTSENLSDKERDFLIVELRLVRKIITFLDSPDILARNARIMVEQQLSAN